VWNLPNLISLVRVFMVPLLFLVFYHPSPLRNLWAAGIFAVASLTDFLDGYLARRWKLSSALGLLSNNLFPWAASP
jgi:CDP-diacylglycerol---glycerol-3-phosphate 3-phosphatidyltransferase